MRKILAAAAVLALVTACGGSDGEDAEEDRPTVEDVLAESSEELAGRAPGVTEDAIRVGVTYVDTEALRPILDLDHGDYEGVYRALFDRINAEGGIHGRRIEPVFAAVNPASGTSGEVACAELTRQEVYVTMGFFQADALSCYLETYDTAVIGGPMTADLLERADPPWFTAEPSSDVGAEVIRSLAETGQLEGRLGVVALTADEETLGDALLQLDGFGIQPAASGLIDDRSEAAEGSTDTAEASVAEIADRFEDAGVDKVLVIGTAAASWAVGAAPLDYRPQLLFTVAGSVNAYVSDESSDVGFLEGAIAGSLYDGDDVPTLPAMQECLGTVEAAGLETLEPATERIGPRPLVATSVACRNVALFRAIAEAANPDMTYGSFRVAGEGLGEVTIPGYPDPFTYGSPPSTDGDPVTYLFRWDPSARAFVVQDPA